MVATFNQLRASARIVGHFANLASEAVRAIVE
jgi:hypothetical protein